MFLTVSSLTTVLEFLKRVRLEKVHAFLSGIVHGEKVFKDPICVIVVELNTLDHEAKREGPVVLKVVVFVSYVNAFNVNFEASSQLNDPLQACDFFELLFQFLFIDFLI